MALKPKTVPPRWRKDVESVLITDEQLAKRIKILAREIEKDFAGREMVVRIVGHSCLLVLAKAGLLANPGCGSAIALGVA